MSYLAMAALTGLSSGGVAIANAHHAPLDRQASWLLVIWGRAASTRRAPHRWSGSPAWPWDGSARPRHSLMSRQHARLDELHSRIGCQPIFGALFPRGPGRHHAANLPACALSSYNLRNPSTIIG